MAASKKTASIFSHKLDRVAFTAYFLGAIVPLIALAVVVERYVMPAVTDRYVTMGLMALVASIAVLSFASFLTLRRSTRHSLEQMDRDNKRLDGLLAVSDALSRIEHASDAAAKSARSALELSAADATFVWMRGEAGHPPVLLWSAGDNVEKLQEEHASVLLETAKLVLSSGRPAIRGGDRGGPSLAAAPLPGEFAATGVMVCLRDSGAPSFGPSEQHVLTTLAGLASVSLHNAELRESQRNFFTHVTDILVSALDANLDYSSGHGTRVAQYANRVGRELGLADHRLQRLHFAALLHDIGMLKMSREQQQDTRARPKHTLLGARMLARIRLWEDLAPLVQHHHEWWDGSGYPEGTSGEAIPMESRIIAVCDAFDAMTSSTSYKAAQTLEASIHELESGAGTQFDPRIAATLVRLVRDGSVAPESPS